jgi:hypothetical protein
MHSKSNTLLVRAADRSTNVAISEDLEGWAVVDVASEYWAGLFRK